jgi:hypothetical protein
MPGKLVIRKGVKLDAGISISHRRHTTKIQRTSANSGGQSHRELFRQWNTHSIVTVCEFFLLKLLIRVKHFASISTPDVSPW